MGGNCRQQFYCVFTQWWPVQYAGYGKGILIVMGHTTEEAKGQVPTAQPSRKGKERKPCKCGLKKHTRVSFHGCLLKQTVLTLFANCLLHYCHNFCISSLAISLIYALTFTFHLKECACDMFLSYNLKSRQYQFDATDTSIAKRICE